MSTTAATSIYWRLEVSNRDFVKQVEMFQLFQLYQLRTLLEQFRGDEQLFELAGRDDQSDAFGITGDIIEGIIQHRTVQLQEQLDLDEQEKRSFHP